MSNVLRFGDGTRRPYFASIKTNNKVRKPMAHKLVFTPDRAKIFELIFDGYNAIARPEKREEHKLNNRVLDQLEKISDLDLSVKDGKVIPGYNQEDPEAPRRRVLKPGGGFCIFEDPAFEYLKTVLGKITTAPKMSRLVEPMWDMIDAAKNGRAEDLVLEEQPQPVVQ